MSVDGILLLDKPLGISSNAALQRAKKLFGAKKAGHTGSLDPLATGMLPICFGEATKFSQFLLDANKSYFVIAQLGVKTTTGDSEGDVIATEAVNVTATHLQSVMQTFLGDIQQTPPMYSALKVNGEPLYKLARKGETIERKSRPIKIYALELADFKKDIFSFSVTCSKGTYVRTLVEEIGEKLRCGAHVTTLRRTKVSPYEEGRIYTLDELYQADKLMGAGGLLPFLLPMDSALTHLPAITLSMEQALALQRGQAIQVESLLSAALIRLMLEGKFIGVGEKVNNIIKPKRLVSYVASRSS